MAVVGLLSGCAASPNAVVSNTLCFTCTGESCHLTATPQELELTNGIFAHGDIDFTGDGVPEHVQLDDSQVIIHQDGVEVWRSPEAWDVVDVALGDPNDDGRGEVLVVFWREDETGGSTNQPFIIGYRGGYYRELWGGSPVGYPIAEVELADITGDGCQDILVLESSGDNGTCTIAVWQWRQWWFSHVWRSEVGAYHDLQVGWDAKQQAMMCVVGKK